VGEDYSINAEPGTFRITDAPVQLVMTSYLLLDWFEVAIRHEQAAGSAQETGDMTRERQEAMIAAAASAHTLEGLHLELEAEIDPGERRAARAAEPGRGTAANVNVVLALGLGVDREKWRSRSRDLFDTLRNQAVHPKAKPHEPVPHPDAGRAVSVSSESAVYWLGNARESVDLVCEVMRTPLESDTPAAVEVASRIRPRVEQLLDARNAEPRDSATR
jgi:hypothetical protein